MNTFLKEKTYMKKIEESELSELQELRDGISNLESPERKKYQQEIDKYFFGEGRLRRKTKAERRKERRLQRQLLREEEY